MPKLLSIKWNDKTYKSISTLAKHFNIHRDTLYYRIKRYGTERACEYYEAKLYGHQTRINSKPIAWNGILYPSIKAISEHFNVKPYAFYTYTHKNGIQNACKYYEEKNKNVLRWNGITFSSYSDAAKHFNKDRSSFVDMVKKKGFIRTCDFYNTPTQIVWKDKTYISQTELITDLKANQQSFYYYAKKHGLQKACIYYEAKKNGILNLKSAYEGRDNIQRYTGTCACCNQQLILTEQEICSFQCSDLFCQTHSINTDIK